MTRELTLLTRLSHLRLVAGMMSPGDIREPALLPADAQIDLDFGPADDVHLLAVAAVPQVRRLVVTGDTVTAEGIAAISGHPWLGQCELKRHGNQLCWFPK